MFSHSPLLFSVETESSPDTIDMEEIPFVSEVEYTNAGEFGRLLVVYSNDYTELYTNSDQTITNSYTYIFEGGVISFETFNGKLVSYNGWEDEFSLTQVYEDIMVIYDDIDNSDLTGFTAYIPTDKTTLQEITTHSL